MFRRYFIAGFTWDGESQKERFIDEGIWENGYDDKYQDVYNSIRIGDYIALKSTFVQGRKSVLRIHKIGTIQAVSSETMRVNVDWFNDVNTKDITDITWYSQTLCEITNEDHIYKIFNMNESKEKVQLIEDVLKANYNLILTGAPGTGKTYLAKQIAQQMVFGEVKNHLTDEERKQFNEQCGFVQFHPSYDYTDFVEGLRPKHDDKGNIGFERKDGIFKDFCRKALNTLSFDMCYSQLLKDIQASDDMKIMLKSGEISTPLSVSGDSIKWREAYNADNTASHSVTLENLKKLYQKYDSLAKLEQIGNVNDAFNDIINRANHTYYWAVLNKILCMMQKKYVFVIDEINRGEIAKIFGELFFSIDPGYRGKDGRVRTQYANMQTTPNEFDALLGVTETDNCGHFYVPENVYIIGTMNDIDRSVESMDFAFRRRFAFKEVKSEDRMGMLDNLAWKDDAIKRMTKLNHEIEKIEGLSSAYHIGPAYFLKLENYNGDFDQLWENHLEGLLLEYMRGMADVPEKMKKLAIAFGYSKMKKDE